MAENQETPGAGAGIPTQEEIAKLPRWAQVAFAARCARRVQPLVVFHWPKAPQEHIEAIDAAITLAERSAGDPRSASATNAYVAARVVYSAYAINDPNAAAYAARAAANAAAYAADADVAVASAADATNAYATNAYADAYAAAASAAVNAAASAAANSTHKYIRIDFDLLCAVVVRQGFKNETPVSPEVFGPMWPDGVPKGWLGEQSQVASEISSPDYDPIELRIRVPANVTDANIQRNVSELLAGANALHHAEGGSGFEVDNIEASKNVGRIGDVVEDQQQPPYEREIIIQLRARNPSDERATHAIEVVRDTVTGFVQESERTELDPQPVEQSYAKNDQERLLDPVLSKQISKQLEDENKSLDQEMQELHEALDVRNYAQLARSVEMHRAAAEQLIDHSISALRALWHRYAPRGWLQFGLKTDRMLRIEISLPDDASDEEVERIVADLILAASQRHQQLGGSGLKVDTLYIDSPALVPSGGAQ
jgi:hypothetical protein